MQVYSISAGNNTTKPQIFKGKGDLPPGWKDFLDSLDEYKGIKIKKPAKSARGSVLSNLVKVLSPRR